MQACWEMEVKLLGIGTQGALAPGMGQEEPSSHATPKQEPCRPSKLH